MGAALAMIVCFSSTSFHLTSYLTAPWGSLLTYEYLLEERESTIFLKKPYFSCEGEIAQPSGRGAPQERYSEKAEFVQETAKGLRILGIDLNSDIIN